MADHDPFRVWMYAEFIPPFVLVLFVTPVGWLAGPYTSEHFLHQLTHVFASGEVVAVSFCALLPMAVLIVNKAIHPAVAFWTAIVLFFSVGFYWILKTIPAFPVPHLKLDIPAGRPVVYSVMSGAIGLFAATVGYRVKRALA
jgi:hypothetical protein